MLPQQILSLRMLQKKNNKKEPTPTFELIQIVRTAQNAPHGTELGFQATNWRRYSIGVSFVLS